MRASSSLVKVPLELSTYSVSSPASKAPAAVVPVTPSMTRLAAAPLVLSMIVCVTLLPPKRWAVIV